MCPCNSGLCAPSLLETKYERDCRCNGINMNKNKNKSLPPLCAPMIGLSRRTKTEKNAGFIKRDRLYAMSATSAFVRGCCLVTFFDTVYTRSSVKKCDSSAWMHGIEPYKGATMGTMM